MQVMAVTDKSSNRELLLDSVKDQKIIEDLKKSKKTILNSDQKVQRFRHIKPQNNALIKSRNS